MNYEDLIAAAREAVGEGDPDDHAIAPARHADQLAVKAPALAKILRSSAVGSTARLYQQKDAEALQAQQAFKTTAARANAAVFLTASLSALLLITAPMAIGTAGLGNWLTIFLGSCGIVSGALGSMWLFKLREGKLLERWMTARAGAETRRLKYFELVTSSPAAGPEGSIPLPLLQLEYFRRYQLEVQRVFYRRRGAEHERAADKMLTLSAVSVALASFATGIGGLLGGALHPQWVSLAGFGAIATAIASFASAKEAIGQDRRNMERYRRALEALENLSEKLDAVRLAAAAGEREPLEQFVAAVHEQISLEHRQWLEASESTTESIAKLEDALARAKVKPADAAGAQADPAHAVTTEQREP
ncbi:MAG TPA: SLATT domain-containing protein [Candidatus Acidoferrales bacterium]|nr:SLATT domain-containing protein [Candidatus Acidoferrales bacterium]